MKSENTLLLKARKGASRGTWHLSFIIMVVLLLIISTVQSGYLLPYNLSVKLRTWIPLILVAYGQTLVVLGGGIDLSVGTMIALVNVTTVKIMSVSGFSTAGIAAALICGICTGIAAGLINGMCVAYLRFQPLITTFATGVIWKGIALWIMPESGGGVPMSFYDAFSGSFLFLPIAVWILIALFAGAVFLSRKSYFIHLKAVGGNQNAAFETGLRVSRIKMSSYVLCGIFVAAASIMIIGETITGNPHAGQGYDIESVSAVALGGTNLAGGIGGPLGSIFGAAIIKLVNDAIFFLGIPVEFQRLMQGLILLAALATGGFFSVRSRKESR